MDATETTSPDGAPRRRGTRQTRSQATSARFWDRTAGRYAASPVADEAAYQRKLALTRQYLRPDMEVLEFGCGTGSTALAHAAFVRHVRATDSSGRMIEIARGKAAAGGVGNVTFERAAIDEVEAPEGGYDAVMAHSVLHLLPDRDAAIGAVYRMLKPGGVFVSSTACLGGSLRFAWLRPVLPVGRALGLLPLVRFFSAADLKGSLTRAGFDIDHAWQPGPGKAVFIVARKP